MPAAERYRNFATVFYPDSCAFDQMKDFLTEIHVPVLISPLHDKDYNPTGEPKKPHWHVMIMFEGKKSKDQIKKVLEGSGAVGLEIVNSSRSYARYLCHLDNPEKTRYSEDEVTCLNGADFYDIIGTPTNKLKACHEMIDWCNENYVLSYDLLVDYAKMNRPDWDRVLAYSGLLYVKE